MLYARELIGQEEGTRSVVMWCNSKDVNGAMHLYDIIPYGNWLISW